MTKSTKTDDVSSAPKGATEKTKKPVRKGTTEGTEKRRVLKWSFISTTAVVLLLVGGATVYAFVYDDRIPPHTTIGGVKVGGLTESGAKQALADRWTTFNTTELTVTFNGKEWNVTPEKMGTAVAADEAVESVWKSDKTGTWTHQAKQLFASLFTPRRIDVGFIPLSESGRQYLTENVLTTIESPYQETTLAFEPGDVKIIEGKSGQKLNEDEFERALYRSYSKGDTTIALSLAEFKPELTVAQAEAARIQAADILSTSWTLAVPAGVKAVAVTPKDMAALLKTDIERDTNGVATHLILAIKTETAQEALRTWGEEIRQAPANAQLAWDGTTMTVTTAGVDGRDLNIEKSLATVSQHLTTATKSTTHILPIVVDVARPEVRADTLGTLGIKELIGSATTDYTGSPVNRKFNIARGQAALDRILVKPGEIFSTTGTLGPVEESTGYLAELVIKGNRTIPEAGGGLCQVSTTLFRSVLNAGLQITERQNHAYRVSYYEREVGPGLDATVYIPNPDLKWKNDMATAVFVQSKVNTKDNKITFDIFGTKDGRVSTISQPEILETYNVGAPIYSNTDSLFEGETRQIEKPHSGAKTKVDYSVTRDGKEIYRKTFISVYRAWPAQFLVGTKPRGEVPAPEETPLP